MFVHPGTHILPLNSTTAIKTYLSGQIKKLSKNNFDTELIKKLSCNTYLEKTDLTSAERNTFNCDNLLRDGSKYVLPGDIENGEGTQKLLHYTFMF